jgi:hypothetical protein
MGEMMKVSEREERLAKELYTHDMGVHQEEAVSWDHQITYVQDSYRRQAMKIVNTKWFRQEIEQARLVGAYREAVARDEADSNNRVS